MKSMQKDAALITVNDPDVAYYQSVGFVVIEPEVVPEVKETADPAPDLEPLVQVKPVRKPRKK